MTAKRTLKVLSKSEYARSARLATSYANEHTVYSSKDWQAMWALQIYVKREYGNGREDSWLIAQASPAGIVEADEEETIAIYQLVKTVKATAKTKLE